MTNLTAKNPKVIKTVLQDPNGNTQTLEGILYEPKDVVQCHFGSFDKFKVVDAISSSSGKIRRWIFLENKIEPII